MVGSAAMLVGMTGTPARVDWRDRRVVVSGGHVAAQAAGRPEDPAVLLLGGGTWSRDWWADGWCARLVDQGLFVIRFDTRDTGESTPSPPGRPDYTAGDLADDAIGVLDAFDVPAATLVGLSMGGGLAQQIAANHRDRVVALVLMSTSPAWDAGELPGPSAEVMAGFTSPPDDPDWSDPTSVADWVVALERPYAGAGFFDEPELRRLVQRIWERTPSMAGAAVNHDLVAASAPAVDPAALRGLPALVVHGSADPLFPLSHGQALAAALDGELLVVEGAGHQLPPVDAWPQVTSAVARHARRASVRGLTNPEE